jgi:molybdate transport system regulatory protein
MAISACNRLDGEVIELKKGKATTNVRVRTDVGEITLVITSSAVETLELVPGDRVSALFREIDVMLMTGSGMVSTRNRFSASVVDIRKGGVTAEIKLDVGDGRQFMAVIARTAAEEMGLDVGTAVTACVREGDLLLEKGNAINVRNRIAGTITNLRPGTVTTELTLATDHGDLFALLARSVADDMQLAVGGAVTALMRERDFLVETEAEATHATT